MATPPYVERNGSRPWQSLSVKRSYKFTSEYDTTIARNTILLASPTIEGEFLRNDESVIARQEPDGTVVVEVDYYHESLQEANIPLRTPEDPPEASFDTTGGTAHFTQAINLRDWAINCLPDERGKYVNTADPSYDPDDPSTWKLWANYQENSIGLTPDGDVQGVDLVVPKLALTYRKLWLRSAIDTAYIKTLARITGTTNHATFKGFDVEELLFMGARGQTQGNYYSVEYVFDASENIADFVPPGGVDGEGNGLFKPTPLVKRGHDYFWVWYSRQVVAADEDNNRVAIESGTAAAANFSSRPTIAYVQQVYPTSNFGLLGID
jgi:hypothetical protein